MEDGRAESNREKSRLYYSMKFSKANSGHERKTWLAQTFGCKKCPWMESELCPFKGEVTRDNIHANGICGERVKYVKELFEAVRAGKVRVAQEDVAERLIILDTDLFSEYMSTKDKRVLLPFAHINKNLVGHLDKMRRQDEGIKVRMEGLEEHETARRIIETSAKVLEEKGIKELSDLRKEILKTKPKENDNDDKPRAEKAD